MQMLATRMTVGCSAGLIAARSEDRLELEAGADVAQADAEGLTALLCASEEGHLECVRALLEAGADFAQAATGGSTALMLASREGNHECARALLEAASR